MLLLLYGPDTYRAKVNTDELVKKYRSKHAVADFRVFDFSEHDAFEQLKTFLRSASLFSEKKLTVVKNPIIYASSHPDAREFFHSQRASPNNNTIIILRDSSEKIPHQWRFLVDQAAQSHEFKLLEGAVLVTWIHAEAKRHAITLEPALAKKLAEKFESDTWSIHHEIEKLSLLGKKRVNLIDASALAAFGNANVFAFLDDVWQKKPSALIHLERALQHGHDVSQLFHLLAKQSGTLQLILRESTKNLNAHPFVIQKLTRFGKKIGNEHAAAFHARLADYDVKIKRGDLDYETALTAIAARCYS